MEEHETQVVEFGPVRAHAVSAGEAVDLIARRAASGRGGFVLTPNLDHLALSRRNLEFGAAYARAFLSLADGMPLIATSRLLRLPIREKVSGSDLFEPLMARCAADRLPVFFLGATPGTCEAARRKLRAQYPGIELAGYDASHFDMDVDPEAAREAFRRARDRGARLILACLPSVKTLCCTTSRTTIAPRSASASARPSRSTSARCSERRPGCPGPASNGSIASRGSPAASGAGT